MGLLGLRWAREEGGVAFVDHSHTNHNYSLGTNGCRPSHSMRARGVERGAEVTRVQVVLANCVFVPLQVMLA